MPRLALPFVLTLLLWTPAAHAEEPTPADFRPLFDTLQEAAAEGDRGQIAKLFQLDLTLDALKRSGFLGSLPPTVRARIEAVFSPALRMALTTRDVIDPFESYEVRRVRPGHAPGRYFVYVRHRDADRYVSKVMWAVAKGDDGYRIYDYEDLELGLSFSQLIGAGITAGMQGAEEFRTAVDAIMRAREQMLNGDAQGARATIEAVEGTTLPKPVMGVKLMMLAALDLDDGNNEAALKQCTEARALKKDAPVIAYLESMAHNNLEQHDKAFARASAYIEALDGDPSVWIELARAHAGLERSKEAVLVLEKSLEEDPHHPESIGWYAIFLPPEQRKKAVARMLALPDLEAGFELAAEVIVAQVEAAPLKALAEAFIAKRPKHADGPYYLGRALDWLGDKTEAAVEALHKAMVLGKEHEHAIIYLEAWCDLMLHRERPIEGLRRATDKAHAFDYMAWDLSYENGAATLRELCAVAAEHLDADHPRLAFFRAEADYLESLYEKVIERLDATQSTLRAKEAELDEEVRLTLWDIEDRLIRSYVRLERFDEALHVARKIYDVDGDPQYLVVVYACSGKIKEAVKALTECLESGDYDPTDLFDDEDAFEALQGEAFAALRAKYYDNR